MLARAGARVLLTSRNVSVGEAAARKILADPFCKVPTARSMPCTCPARMSTLMRGWRRMAKGMRHTRTNVVQVQRCGTMGEGVGMMSCCLSLERIGGDCFREGVDATVWLALVNVGSS